MEDKPATIRVGVAPADHAAAEKLRAAIEAAGFKPGVDEGQVEWVLAQLAGSLSVYFFMTGRDPDTPEGERRLLEEQIRKAREQNPQFQYKDLEPVPSEGKRLAGFIKAIKAAREHWCALPGELQMELGLSPLEIREHADGAIEGVPADPLQVIIERAERVKTERTGGRAPADALNSLLHVITVQWRCAFDPDPENNPFLGIVRHGAAKDRKGDEAQIYSGGLLDFALAVLDSHDIDPKVGGADRRSRKHSALGRRLYDLTKKWWPKSRPENHSAKTN